MVGSPDRDNLWILSRRTQLAPADLQNALAVAKAQGYALDELRYTPQQR
ncbi:lipocalin-like protein [Bordetella bronchiseptica E013]|nr:lipocalin-like protein [Bordetella bronchiseptica E013]